MGWLFLKSRDICSSPRPPRPKCYSPQWPRSKCSSPRPKCSSPRPKCSSPRPKCSSPRPPRPKCSSPRPVTEIRCFMINIDRVRIQMSMLRSAIPWTVQHAIACFQLYKFNSPISPWFWWKKKSISFHVLYHHDNKWTLSSSPHFFFQSPCYSSLYILVLKTVYLMNSLGC